MTPLIQATTKKTLEWSDDLQTSFDECKKLFLSDQVLALPNYELSFNIASDACDYGVGGVLSQEGQDYVMQIQVVAKPSSKKVKRFERPISFFSKQLNKQQAKYSATERELLAIVLTVEHFKQFLYWKKFKIYTDHQPLK